MTINECSWTRFITISGKEDKLSDKTAEQIMRHDMEWKSRCSDNQK